MTTAPHLLPLYNHFLDYLVEKASPQEILAFMAPPEAQAYAHELLERNSAGVLSLDEQQMLEQNVQFEQMMALLKAKALKALRLA
jgi:hypothetical protein